MRLFVYGTLAPGQENEHLLAAIGGHWEPGSVRGVLHPNGIGRTLGYPALDLDPNGAVVEGLIFSARDLAAHWPELDDFEGDGYERVDTEVTRGDGSTVSAFVYQRRR